MRLGRADGEESIGECEDLKHLARMFSGGEWDWVQILVVVEGVNGFVLMSRTWSYADERILQRSCLKWWVYVPVVRPEREEGFLRRGSNSRPWISW